MKYLNPLAFTVALFLAGCEPSREDVSYSPSTPGQAPVTDEAEGVPPPGAAGAARATFGFTFSNVSGALKSQPFRDTPAVGVFAGVQPNPAQPLRAFVNVVDRSGALGLDTRLVQINIQKAPGDLLKQGDVLAARPGPVSYADVVYQESSRPGGTLRALTFHAQGGTVTVTGLSSSSFTLRLDGVAMVPRNASTTGSFLFNGTASASF